MSVVFDTIGFNEDEPLYIKKKRIAVCSNLYRSFLRTMMRVAECKPISKESRPFYEIAQQDKRRSDFNRLLLRWWIALVCVLLNKIWLHRVLCSARLFVHLAIFLLFPRMSIKCQRLRALYELWSDISRGKNDGFIKFANRKAYFNNYMSNDSI